MKPDALSTPIGVTLVQLGLISQDQLHIALHEQRRDSGLLGQHLVRLGFLSEAVLRDALADALEQTSIDLGTQIPDGEALALIPHELASRFRLIPLSHDATRRHLLIATSNSNDVAAHDHLLGILPAGTTIETRLAGESEIARAIDQFYGHTLSIDGILHEIETGTRDGNKRGQTRGEYAQPVVRLVDSLLTDAVKRGASDIHFEPEAGFLRIRYRLDGLLRQIRALHKSHWPAMTVRLKVMAGLNIAETRAPQDGRISLQVSGRPVDFRVASQPTIHGENIVLRVLDRQKGIVSLAELGLADDALEQLKLMISRPEGLILVTGPTGSGKTTTLYSILNQLNTEHVNIMTLEDPVEYPLAMIRQTAVADAARLDFANGVRSMLRQDPDVILVGEIRDADTARMALQAAMTGHQVYSTLHTNSAIGAIPRLLDIGIQPDILAGNLIGIIAQRLVRRLCPECREAYPAEQHELHLLGVSPRLPHPVLYRAKGCARCNFQGYRGRLAIIELLRLDTSLDELITRRASAREILTKARAHGFASLAEDGVRRALEGCTTLAELARVVDLTTRVQP